MLRKLFCRLLYLHDFSRGSYTRYTRKGPGEVNVSPHVHREWLECSTCGYIRKIKSASCGDLIAEDRLKLSAAVQ